MTVPNKPPSLPPRISGQLRSILTLEISRFAPTGDAGRRGQEDQVVKILWWGQDKPEEVRIPSSSSSSSSAAIRYDVLTTTRHFKDYLRDAEKLFLEICEGGGKRRRVGFAVIDDLTRMADEKSGGSFTHTSEVFDDGGDVVGSLRCRFTTQDDVEKKKGLEAKVDKGQQRPSNGSSSSSGSSGRPIYRPPSKARKSPVDGRKKHSSPDTSQSLPSSPLKNRRQQQQAKDEERPRVTFSQSATNLSASANEDNGGLKRILLRSRQRLEGGHKTATAAQQEKPPPLLRHEEVNKAVSQPMLPSWNLSISRLHFISTVVQLSVDIRCITWSPNVLNLIREETRRPRLVLKSRPRSASSSTAGSSEVGRSSSADPISFFVSFVIPPSTMTTSFCSRKVSGNRVAFSEKFVQPLLFKPELLDVWWTTNLTFKVLTRSMKQRESTLVGEASIGLKYLLTDAKNSDGGVLKLPIYSGQKFFGDHKLDSEIVGDLHLSFLLSPGGGGGRPGGTSKYRPVSPQRAVRDGDTESTNEEEQTTRHPAHTHPREERSSAKIVLRSKGSSGSTSRPDVYNEATGSERNIFCLLRVSEGRNFSLNRAAKQMSLYVSTRFLNSGDVVRSQTCWNSTRPAFNMMYYVPVKLDSDFLRRCHNNFLVIEVWNHGDPAQIVGVSMIPLQQFFLSFKDDNRTEAALRLESPVVAVNDWMPVTNLFDGGERGEVKVTLAAGTDKQIKRLMPRVTPTTDSEPPSEHIYDSVDVSTSTSISSQQDPFIPDRRQQIADDKKTTVTEEETAAREKSKKRQESDASNEMLRAATEALGLKEKQDYHKKNRQTFRTEITVEEARSLPKVFNTAKSEKILPSAFATFSPVDNCTVATNVIPRCSNPEWHFKTERMLSTDFLTDPRRYFIIRLWHHYAEDDVVANLENDHVIGFAAIDLRPLVAGFPSISGWYNIMDFSGRCRGQIKVTLVPMVDVKKFVPSSSLRRDSEAFVERGGEQADVEFFVSAKYDRFPSHVVQHTEQIVTARSPMPTCSGKNPGAPDKGPTEPSSTTYSSSDISSRSSENDGGQDKWQLPPRVTTPSEEHFTRSFLDKKLNEMDATTQKLRDKLDDNRRSRTEKVGASAVSLEELQADIEANLLNLRRTAGNLPTRNSVTGNSGQFRTGRSNLMTFPERHLDIPTPTSTSAEIVDIMGNSDDEISESLSQPILNTIRQSTLDDLGSIDWNNLARRDDNAHSRMRPEGGSPAEELRLSRQMTASSLGNSSRVKK